MSNQFQKLATYGDVEQNNQATILVDDAHQSRGSKFSQAKNSITSRIAGLGNPNNTVNGIMDRFSWMNDKRKVVCYFFINSTSKILFWVQLNNGAMYSYYVPYWEKGFAPFCSCLLSVPPTSTIYDRILLILWSWELFLLDSLPSHWFIPLQTSQELTLTRRWPLPPWWRARLLWLKVLGFTSNDSRVF